METLILKHLLESGVVVVPDLGTFRLQHRSARLLKDDSMKFVPPQNVVVFSTDCDNDDSFKSFVAKKTQKSEDEVLHLLKSYAILVKNALHKQEGFLIKGVGVIQPDWSFVSQLSMESSPETFGLTDFSIDTVSEAEKKNAELKGKTIAKVAGKTMFLASPVLFGALLIPNILQVSHNPQFASIFRETQVAMNSAVPEIPRPYVIKPVVTASAELKEIPKEVVPEKKSNVGGKKKKDSVSKKKHNVVSKKKNNVAPKKVDVAVKKSNENSDKKYFVVVGAFSNAEYAHKFAEQLQPKYESGVIEGERNIVYVSAFASKKEALICSRQLRENTTYPRAWVYVKNS